MHTEPVTGAYLLGFSRAQVLSASSLYLLGWFAFGPSLLRQRRWCQRRATTTNLSLKHFQHFMISSWINFPPKVYIGDVVCVKISWEEYESGLAACRSNLHGRLILHRGDSPLTTKSLKLKLSDLWPSLKYWRVIPLGNRFFVFKFQSVEDMCKILALGAVNLRLGISRFYYWTKDFTPQHQVLTHPQV